MLDDCKKKKKLNLSIILLNLFFVFEHTQICP